MPEIKHIKKLRNEKCLSINAITKRTGISWVTAKKYADIDQLPSEEIPKKRGMMYEEKWGEIVSDWLIEDAALKAKLRRNNKLASIMDLYTRKIVGWGMDSRMTKE
ncbi:hypothetical protein [Caldalkalibacillus salinus]|uniref:hypothetical protein n=1 Tax=Caldalkalibacillus salinus TaxID=2803787 RepID=UPI001924AB35|nr:hypothetical protein [Caldalkalibacillus salinus]